MDTNAPNAPKQVQARIREEQAVRLRLAGYTLDKIADSLGVSHQAVSKMLTRAMQRTVAETAGNLEQMRETERQRLEWLMSTLSPQVQKGMVGAVKEARQISESLRKLLGLNMPERVDVTTGGQPLESKVDNERFDRAVSTLADAVRESLSGKGGKSDGPVGSAK